MFIHNTNIYKYVDCFGETARIFMFKVEKSCANGDSVTLEFMKGYRFPNTRDALLYYNNIKNSIVGPMHNITPFSKISVLFNVNVSFYKLPSV